MISLTFLWKNGTNIANGKIPVYWEVAENEKSLFGDFVNSDKLIL